MERLAPGELDLDMAGIVVANFLQSWLLASGPVQEPQAKESSHAIPDSTPPSPEDGLRLSTSVDHGSGAPSPGEHRQAVRFKKQSPEPGLAERPDPSAGCRPGLVWHADQSPPRFQDAGGRCLLGKSGRCVRPRSFPTLAFLQRLAPVAGDLCAYRHFAYRRGWLLRSGRLQRSTAAGTKGNHVPSRATFYSRAPPVASAIKPAAESCVSHCRWATSMEKSRAAY